MSGRCIFSPLPSYPSLLPSPLSTANPTRRSTLAAAQSLAIRKLLAKATAFALSRPGRPSRNHTPPPRASQSSTSSARRPWASSRLRAQQHCPSSRKAVEGVEEERKGEGEDGRSPSRRSATSPCIHLENHLQLPELWQPYSSSRRMYRCIGKPPVIEHFIPGQCYSSSQ
ncbi:hypothetical protein BV22DRAFT_1183106 [Leucogyrophana mollusca]|uniref:Uncharacterized protein n=1 Tax=Leucogyrophana mollusca TaxID=85980 RepID=A0ACB8B3X1_9AGAM|nr:hypothetical protein BV22DRAFT_1183106 [Leucogyrophana mollusca]